VKDNTGCWRWWWWGLCGLLAAAIAVGVGLYLTRPWLTPTVSAQELNDEQPAAPSAVHVEVVRPRKGGLDRTTSQPGTVQAYETVNLYSAVSGFLKTDTVPLLGKHVEKGQVLAVVDVPDLDKQVEQYQAEENVAVAHIDQMHAHVLGAEAELDAARAAVPQAEALFHSKEHGLAFRQKQLNRLRKLLALNSIDEQMVDEAIERRDEAREAMISAQEGVNSAKARVKAAEAKVAQARADWFAAKAEKKSAEARLAKAQVLVNFATITAPFDGIVTQRNYFRMDYIRAASEGGLPVLTVQRTDKFRIVVQVPDRDVPYCDVGDQAVVELDALPGLKFPGVVSRKSDSEDSQTRMMQVEIDLPNPTGKIRNGMYGRATIILDHSDLLAVPSSCLAGKAQDGKGTVFVVRNGVAHKVPVEYGQDNGLVVAIRKGLTEQDQVVLHPGNLTDGMAVVLSTDSHAGAGH